MRNITNNIQTNKRNKSIIGLKRIKYATDHQHYSANIKYSLNPVPNIYVLIHFKIVTKTRN